MASSSLPVPVAVQTLYSLFFLGFSPWSLVLGLQPLIFGFCSIIFLCSNHIYVHRTMHKFGGWIEEESPEASNQKRQGLAKDLTCVGLESWTSRGARAQWYREFAGSR
ncbi:hypothetical protein L228DRAFT_140166 [Xylona heveae TC161]|uniref:Uncharacterized protein n=1 Tax=Xylona heveae (strain CBS 132557 / TC161) TaxID=1328760 RepID=A0A165H411_XYLHT|nr:hypothetical protein L228DRAFT_140166 [Xylona heveae TC161]KZF22956.1 hypothetical protein L228DRAFT_140166 [Xylona heveae TC161]